jgi:hypothetical protein
LLIHIHDDTVLQGREKLCSVEIVVANVEFAIPILGGGLIHGLPHHLPQGLLSGVLDVVGEIMVVGDRLELLIMAQLAELLFRIGIWICKIMEAASYTSTRTRSSFTTCASADRTNSVILELTASTWPRAMSGHLEYWAWNNADRKM